MWRSSCQNPSLKTRHLTQAPTTFMHDESDRHLGRACPWTWPGRRHHRNRQSTALFHNRKMQMKMMRCTDPAEEGDAHRLCEAVPAAAAARIEHVRGGYQTLHAIRPLRSAHLS